MSSRSSWAHLFECAARQPSKTSTRKGAVNPITALANDAHPTPGGQCLGARGAIDGASAAALGLSGCDHRGEMRLRSVPYRETGYAARTRTRGKSSQRFGETAPRRAMIAINAKKASQPMLELIIAQKLGRDGRQQHDRASRRKNFGRPSAREVIVGSWPPQDGSAPAPEPARNSTPQAGAPSRKSVLRGCRINSRPLTFGTSCS